MYIAVFVVYVLNLVSVKKRIQITCILYKSIK